MKKRFIVLIERSTKDQNESFLSWIKGQKLSWWHWFQNVWLLSNSSGSFSAESIRDNVKEFYPGANIFVEELREGEGTWAGLGPNSEERNMFSWLRRTWRKP